MAVDQDGNEVECSWFLLCTNEPTRIREHPILGGVPICERCDEKVERLEA